MPMKLARFENKVALITGAGAGIGRATALRLAEEGARVACIDLKPEAVVETAELVAQNGGEALAVTCDVSDRNSVNAAVATSIDQFGQLDVLGNIAGILSFHHFSEMELASWEKLFSVNVTGVFHVTQAALPHLIETQGNIVNASSSSALGGLPYGVGYSSTKGAISAFTRSLAVELSPHGIRVNAVCPASIVTAMTESTLIPDGAKNRLLTRQAAMDGPRGPEVVAGVIAMIASEDGTHLNGEEIRVDGGALT
ncbi:SDR family oxidoreductase [Myxococcota bacterium]|nr:SDR family oxidoreductase [Myxococcota bacterium]